MSTIGQFLYTPWFILTVMVLIFGLNIFFWGAVGLVRLIGDIYYAYFGRENVRWNLDAIFPHQVAVLVPAHNESLVIADTITSLLKIINKENIFIVSDGSTDDTVKIAKSFGVHVLDQFPGKGKAGALESCIKHFRITNKYKAVLLVDADTRLKEDYLTKALPFFKDSKVVAVAGYAQTIWNPQKLNDHQKLMVLYRDRVYFLNQIFLKFGQTWRYTNVTSIIPGFASIYRTSVLPYINMNPEGLVIEDFNMTFEVHHKNLGLIAHHPSIVAYTQDPDNLQDYFKQIRRWHLGLWQTIKLHGLWKGKFSVALLVLISEVLIGHIVVLLIPIFLVFLLLLSHWRFSPETHQILLPLISFAYSKNMFVWLLVGVWLPDYLLSVLTAIVLRRWEFLTYGVMFFWIRLYDAAAFLIAIPKAFLINSNGQWKSPTRRVN